MVDELCLEADFLEQKYYIGKYKFEVNNRFERKIVLKLELKVFIWQATRTYGKQNEILVTEDTTNGEVATESVFRHV